MSIRVNQKKINSSWKEYVALNFDQWLKFSENSKPVRVSLWLTSFTAQLFAIKGKQKKGNHAVLFLKKMLWGRGWIMICLPNYREYMFLAIFHRVDSKSKEVSSLPWWNKYSDLKTTRYIKPKFFLWIKLLENFLLAKYLKFVVATLNKVCMS